VTGTDNGTFHNFPFRQWLMSVCVGDLVDEAILLQRKHFAAFAPCKILYNRHHRTFSPSWLSSD